MRDGKSMSGTAGGDARRIGAVEVPGGTSPELESSARAGFERLKEILGSMDSLLVAFSGGVDSTFLLKAATMVLGDRVAAITATSPTYPEREFNDAKRLAGELGVRHIVVDSNELEIPNFAENPENRCYYCKSELFGISLERARSLGFSNVADGSNADDLADYRPGSKAAKELGVTSPLQEAGLAKAEIRLLSRALGLSTWDKPSFACLSSRFPYGTRITGERLDRVAAAEEILRALGFTQFRVRFHNETARIEVEPSEIERFLEPGVRKTIVDGFKAVGFTYVTLDLEGYRTGSMNEVLGGEKRGGGKSG